MSIERLQHYIRVYDENLSAPLCRQMISAFEAAGGQQQTNGRGHRAGLDASQWTELNVTRHSEPEFQRYFDDLVSAALLRYNRDTGLSLALPRSPSTADLIMKRYLPGGADQFQIHFDSIYEVANRYLVFLWYLNDVPAGGETDFPDIGLSVSPKAGRLLVFPPYWMFQHAGRPPQSGAKYILSTYLLF